MILNLVLILDVLYSTPPMFTQWSMWHKQVPRHGFYVNSGLTIASGTTCETHLIFYGSWQVWKFFPPSFKAVSRLETSMELEVSKTLRKHHPELEIFIDHPNRFYDVINTSVAPLPSITTAEDDP